MAKKINKALDPVAEFFKAYPKAPAILKVGNVIFLPIHQNEALKESKQTGLEIETVVNQNSQNGTQ